MADGLSILLELNAKVDGAMQMVAGMKQVMDALKKTKDKLDEAEKKSKTTLARMGKWFKDFGKSAASDFTGHFAASAVWDMIKNGVLALKDLGVEMVTTAGEAERTSMAFENMLGKEKGKQMLDFFDAFADASEFTDGPIKELGQRLVDVGISGENMEFVMAAIGDTAARFTNKMEGAQGAAAALAKVWQSGQLEPRMLRSALRIEEEDVVKQLADDLRLTPELIRKALKDVKIDKQTVLDAVLRTMAIKSGGAVGKHMGEMRKGFLARWEKFKDIVPNLFEETASSPGLRKLGETMDKVTKLFAPGSSAADRITAGLSGLLTGVAAIIQKIDWDNFTRNLVDLIGKLPAIIGALGKAGDFLITMVGGGGVATPGAISANPIQALVFRALLWHKQSQATPNQLAEPVSPPGETPWMPGPEGLMRAPSLPSRPAIREVGGAPVGRGPGVVVNAQTHVHFAGAPPANGAGVVDEVKTGVKTGVIDALETANIAGGGER